MEKYLGNSGAGRFVAGLGGKFLKDAPLDGKVHGRKNGAWVPVESAGDGFDGAGRILLEGTEDDPINVDDLVDANSYTLTGWVVNFPSDLLGLSVQTDIPFDYGALKVNVDVTVSGELDNIFIVAQQFVFHQLFCSRAVITYNGTLVGSEEWETINLSELSGGQGSDGINGWSPILANVVDGSRIVQQVIDWTGGTGSKPVTGQYIGSTGLVSNISLAIDIRGAQGIQGIPGIQGLQGNPGVGIPTGGTTNQVLLKSSGTDYATSWGNAVLSDNIVKIQKLTQAEYDALNPPLDNTLYLIVG